MPLFAQLKKMDRKLLAMCHIVLVFILQALLFAYSRKLEKIPLLTTILHVSLFVSTMVVHAVNLDKEKNFSVKSN